jgi:hypothetical protein
LREKFLEILRLYLMGFFYARRYAIRWNKSDLT